MQELHVHHMNAAHSVASPTITNWKLLQDVLLHTSGIKWPTSRPPFPPLFSSLNFFSSVPHPAASSLPLHCQSSRWCVLQCFSPFSIFPFCSQRKRKDIHLVCWLALCWVGTADWLLDGGKDEGVQLGEEVWHMWSSCSDYYSPLWLIMRIHSDKETWPAVCTGGYSRMSKNVLLLCLERKGCRDWIYCEY